ncbi:MAG: methyltransferase domain-containing protein [Hyphomonadaceae bacterium]
MASIHSSPGKTKFGSDPDQYDLARPGYPAALFDWLRARCSLNAQSDCFEIGAGTGHATLPVLATPVRYLLAIEPDGRLAEKMREKASGDARLTIEIARFEAAALPPGFFDFGFAATSFHWVPRMKSLARAKDALKPGGHFAMWWHVFHDAARPDGFDHATAHLFDGLEQDPEATNGRPAFAMDIASRLGELRAAGFVDAEHRLFSKEIVFSSQRLSALYGTFSRVRMAPDTTRARLLSDVERIAREDFGGEVRRTVVSSAYCARKP